MKMHFLDGGRLRMKRKIFVPGADRDAPADVTVRDNSLSRQHATIELSGGQVWVEDLESTNGTRIEVSGGQSL